MDLYRRKEVLEAIQWTGYNLDEVKEFIENRDIVYVHKYTNMKPYSVFYIPSVSICEIFPGDYITKKDGEFFMYSKYDFENTYEKVILNE